MRQKKFWNTKVLPKWNWIYGIHSKNNLPEIKDRASVINLDEYKSIGTYFDSFRVEHVPKEIKKFKENKNIITNIYRIQAYDLIMCGYFCIGFIDFMLKGTSFDYTNLISPNDYDKNEKILLKYFQ